MDQTKKCKCGEYFSSLIEKAGLTVPVFGALAMFAILFLIRFIGLFDSLASASPIGYWLFIVASILGIVLLAVYFIMTIKKPELGTYDTLLLTFDFLMVFLLFGTIIFDFVNIETVYYAIALVVVIVFNVLRIKFACPECIERKQPSAANVGFKKYFATVIDKYKLWVLILAAVAVYGFLVFSDVWNFPTIFLENAYYTAGLLLVGGIAALMAVFAIIERVRTREICSFDALLVLTFFVIILCLITVLSDLTVTGVVIWLASMFIIVALMRIAALNTFIPEETTDDAYFATDKNKKFYNGPKVYFKEFYGKFNLFILGAIALFAFAVLDACVSLDAFGWAGKHGYMVMLIAGMFVIGLMVLVYLSKALKRDKIGIYDAVLAVLDVSLLLLTISVFGNWSNGNVMTSLVLWAIVFALCIAFTITRLFMVKEYTNEPLPPKPEKDPVEKKTWAQIRAEKKAAEKAAEAKKAEENAPSQENKQEKAEETENAPEESKAAPEENKDAPENEADSKNR